MRLKCFELWAPECVLNLLNLTHSGINYRERKSKWSSILVTFCLNYFSLLMNFWNVLSSSPFPIVCPHSQDIVCVCVLLDIVCVCVLLKKAMSWCVKVHTHIDGESNVGYIFLASEFCHLRAYLTHRHGQHAEIQCVMNVIYSFSYFLCDWYLKYEIFYCYLPVLDHRVSFGSNAFSRVNVAVDSVVVSDAKLHWVRLCINQFQLRSLRLLDKSEWVFYLIRLMVILMSWFL